MKKMKTTKYLPRVESQRFPKDLLNPKRSPEEVQQFHKGMTKTVINFFQNMGLDISEEKNELE